MSVHGWTAVAGTRDVDHVYIFFPDQAVQMNVNEVLACGCPPMSEQAGFDVLPREGFFKQGILAQIDLADRQVVGGAPIAVQFVEKIRRERLRSGARLLGLSLGSRYGG